MPDRYDLTGIDPAYVSFVKRGSVRQVNTDGTVNPAEHQRFIFWKHEAADHTTPTKEANVPEELTPHLEAIAKNAADVTPQQKAELVKVLKLEAPAPKVETETERIHGFAKAEWEKLPEQARVVIEKAEKDAEAVRVRLEKVELERAAEKVSLRKAELVSLAKSELTHVPGLSSDDLGGVLQAIEEKAPDAFAKLVPVLKSASAVVRESGAFSQIGSPMAGSGGPTDQLNAMAVEIKKAEPALTKEQAYAKALETPEGQALYNRTQAA